MRAAQQIWAEHSLSLQHGYAPHNLHADPENVRHTNHEQLKLVQEGYSCCPTCLVYRVLLVLAVEDSWSAVRHVGPAQVWDHPNPSRRPRLLARQADLLG